MKLVTIPVSDITEAKEELDAGFEAALTERRNEHFALFLSLAQVAKYDTIDETSAMEEALDDFRKQYRAVKKAQASEYIVENQTITRLTAVVKKLVEQKADQLRGTWWLKHLRALENAKPYEVLPKEG